MCAVCCCGGGAQKAGQANNNKTAAAAKPNDRYQADQTPYVFLSPSHSVCLSFHLSRGSHRKDRRSVHRRVEPGLPAADRKWPYIGFCLHSGCLISLPLSSPLSSLRAVSTATVFCFPRWQEEKIRVQNEKRGGAGWEMRARAYESGMRKIKERKEGCCADRAQEGHQAL